MSTPTVTAVVPVYNAQEYLADALSSILEQDIAKSLECVVVDDGSTDNSVRVAESFEPRVRIIRQANKGVSAARNVGIEAAAGRYIAFLDADDLWLPRKTSRQVSILDTQESIGYVYCGYWLADEDLQVRDIVLPPPDEVAIQNTLTLVSPSINLAQTGMARRATLERVGGFDEQLSTSADLDMVLRLAAETAPRAIQEPLAIYRRHKNQMSLNVDSTHRDMEVVLSHAFGGPLGRVYGSLEQASFARLYVMLAKMALHSFEPVKAMKFLAKALRSDLPAATRALTSLT